MHHKFQPLITIKDCRLHIRSMSLIEDYLSNYLKPKLLLRAFLILIVRILAVASSYIPPIILTQMEDTPQKYFLMLISLFFDYFMQRLQNTMQRELLILINASISQQLFLHCLHHQTQSTFSGILVELRQIERAIGSFYTLVLITFELVFVYYLLRIQVIFDALMYGIMISLLALAAASVAQIYAWRIRYFSDRRLRLTQEILSGIKSIKYLQWEGVFLKLIDNIRTQEFKGNQGVQYVDTFINFFRRMTQVVLLFVVFYKLQQLDQQYFYTLLIFFDKLVHPLNTFPWCLGEFLGSFFSIIRLWDFFRNKTQLKQVNNKTITLYSHTEPRVFDKVIALIQGSKGERKANSFNLTMNFDCIPQKKLTCVVGKVASGKSILLEHICNGVYVPQTPWLFSGTVRENIVFGSQYNEERYQRAIVAAAIDFDDQKQVGFNGTNLSGGQRSRVAFCRALYQESDSYFFDDIFSSVDENVADMMFKTIRTVLKNKTVVIVLNQQQYIQYADYLINIRNDVANLEQSQNCNLAEVEFTPNRVVEVMEPLPPEKEIDIETEQNLVANYTFYIQTLGVFALTLFIVFSLGHQAFKGGFELWIYKNIGNQFDKEQFINIFIILGILTLLRGFAYSYAVIVSARKIFAILMNKFIHLPVKYFDNFSPTYYIRRLFDDMSSVDDLPLNYFFMVVLDSFALIALVASVQLEILIYVIIATILIVKNLKPYRYYKVMYQKQINLFYPTQEYDSFVVEIEKGIKSINSFNKQEYVLQKFKMLLLHKYALNLGQEEINSIKNLRNFIIQTIALILLIITGNQMSYSYSYLFFGKQLLSTSIDSWQSIIGLSQTLQRILQIKGFPEESDQKAIEFTDDKIIFKDVWLSYGMAKGMANADYALKGINFSVKKGEKIAFCGRTGSGKSSLFNLLVGLYEYQQGDILFFGNSIKDYGFKQLRQSMSVIPQQGILIEGSIRQNIDPNQQYSDEKILKLIKQMEIKLDLDKRCDNLSSGEKQILNYIQSIILDRDIILMDEATSNMDPITSIFIFIYLIDDKIMKSLFQIVQNKTLLLISHRLENLQKFDRIYVMVGGTIVETGTYQELTNGTTKFNELKTKL